MRRNRPSVATLNLFENVKSQTSSSSYIKMGPNLVVLIVFGLIATLIGIVHLLYNIWRDGNCVCLKKSDLTISDVKMEGDDQSHGLQDFPVETVV